MIGSRIKRFREYNGLDVELICSVLGVSAEEYNDYEACKVNPRIEIVEKLAAIYRVTVDELYGFNPRLELHSNEISEDDQTAEIDGEILEKMSELAWDEKLLVLNYRTSDKKEEILNKAIESNKP